MHTYLFEASNSRSHYTNQSCKYAAFLLSISEEVNKIVIFLDLSDLQVFDAR